jgi:hypothetical protein
MKTSRVIGHAEDAHTQAGNFLAIIMLTILTCKILLVNGYVISLIQILRWNFVRRRAAMRVIDCAQRRLGILLT